MGTIAVRALSSIAMLAAAFSVAGQEPAALEPEAEDLDSRGVNPADIDNRIDLIAKYVMLDGEGDVLSITGKFDKKLTDKSGLSFELPLYTRLDTPQYSVSGNGDLYTRVRHIVQKGKWSVGGALELVLPTASSDALGTGKYQLNAAVLGVRPVNRHFMYALVMKQGSSVAGDDARNDISYTEFRALPIFILQDGWAVTAEYRRIIGHGSDNPDFTFAEIALNKQLSYNWALTGSYSKNICDCRVQDDGGVLASVKYFF